MRSNQPVVCCLVGLSGVGKSEATRIMADLRGFDQIYFGSAVLEEVERRGLDVTPENEKIVRNDLRQQHGMAAMALKKMPEILKSISAGNNVLIDGLYSYAEYKLLRSSHPDNFKVVALHADKYVRIKRLSKRPVRPLTAFQIDERDKSEVEELEKAQPIALADFHVLNNGNILSLTDRLQEVCEKLFCHG